MTVSFSTRAPNSDYLGFEASPEAIVAAAKKAEAIGFDAIFVNNHIVVGNERPLGTLMCADLVRTNLPGGSYRDRHGPP